MTTDEAIAYLESEAAKALELAQGLESWQKNASTVRERAVKLKGCS